MKQVAGKKVAASGKNGGNTSRASQHVADGAGTYFVQPIIERIEVSLADVVIGGIDSSGPVDDFVYLDIGSVDREKKVFIEPKVVSLAEAPSRAKQHVHAGDVLVSMTRPNLNAVAQITQELHEAIASTGFHVLRSPCLEAGFLYYLVQTDSFVDAMCGVVQGALYPARDIEGFKFHLPPRAEQTRIVEKLEELLSDLDAGVAELQAAQRKLAQYRQSLLKAAVEGTLTADWRAARHKSEKPPSPSSPRRRGSSAFRSDATDAESKSLDDQSFGLLKSASRLRGNDEQNQSASSHETGADLLQRILTERRTRWESRQLAKFAEQGKTPSKDWKAKYPIPVAPDAIDLPALPEGWVWASVDQLTEFVTSGSRGWADFYANHGATFIRSQNINKDWLDLSDIAFVDPPRNSEGARTRVQQNDLLLTITGANVGKSAWVNIELEEAYVSQHVALIRPVESGLSAYLHLFLTCKAGGRGQLDNEAYGAGKPGLNLQQVLSVVVPLPSPRELPELLSMAASAVDAAATQEASIAHALQQSAAQRKNILKAAFAGQLVPQDPNDEPASALLERIRAERVAAGASASKRGRKVKEAI